MDMGVRPACPGFLAIRNILEVVLDNITGSLEKNLIHTIFDIAEKGNNENAGNSGLLQENK